MRYYQQKHLLSTCALAALAILAASTVTADDKKEKKADSKHQVSIVVTVDADGVKVLSAGKDHQDQHAKALGHFKIEKLMDKVIVLAADEMANDGSSDKKSKKKVMIFRTSDGQNLPIVKGNARAVWHAGDMDEEKEILLEQVVAGAGDSPHRIGVMISGTAGLLIGEVAEDSPAEDAGLRSGDVVLSVDGELVGDVSQLIDGVHAAGKEGKSIKLRIIRGNETLKVNVTPTSEPAEKPADDADPEVSVRPRRRVQAHMETSPAEVQEAIQAAIARATREHGHALRVEAMARSGHQDEQIAAIRELRAEVQRLREEVREIKRSQRRDSDD